MAGLDLNRGVITKFHGNGMRISAYLDTPGTYYDDRGELVPAAFAATAGFDIVKDAKEKLKNQRLTAFRNQLEREMASEEDALASALSNDSNVDVRHIGGGQYAIFDGAKRVTKVGMSEADIEMLLGKKPGELEAERKAADEMKSAGPAAKGNADDLLGAGTAEAKTNLDSPPKVTKVKPAAD